MTSPSTPHPFAADGVSQWSAARPSYLRDLRSEPLVNTETIRMGARNVNGSKFDPDNPTFITTADAVQEWSIRGAGLNANTPYWYRVFASNAAGNSDYSNVASATTLPAGEATALDLGSVSVTTVNKGQGNKAGQATVIVIDDFGSPVTGASVSGDLSGTFNEPGVTGPLSDAGGSTVLETTGTQKGNVSVTFCVTGISHATLTDWSGNVCASN